jgi:hypothetical protein
MTLKEWCQKNDKKAEVAAGTVHVYCDVFEPCRPSLFHLSDYKVSSTAGPLLWMRAIGENPWHPVLQTPSYVYWEKLDETGKPFYNCTWDGNLLNEGDGGSWSLEGLKRTKSDLDAPIWPRTDT